MENYFNYFTEVEERYQRRRGSALLLSTLDWALIETWKDAGIPLEAVLRGIDAAFDAYDKKPARGKTRKVNSLAYCSQEVLAAAQEMKEAAVGTARESPSEKAGIDVAEVRAFLLRNADSVLASSSAPEPAKALAAELRNMAETVASDPAANMEDVERRLTVLEERLFATLLTAASAAELLEIRRQADRDIAPYRSKMIAAQIDQLHRQYVNKRLLERAHIPRLSLFYM